MREPSITLIPCEEQGCILGATYIADDGRGATYRLCHHHAVDRKVRWVGEYLEYLKTAPLQRALIMSRRERSSRVCGND